MNSPELSAMHKLVQDESSWLSRARHMRDQSTHIQGVPRIFYVGGDSDGVVTLKDTRRQSETCHLTAEFRCWLKKMTRFVKKSFRTAAIANTAALSEFLPPGIRPAKIPTMPTTADMQTSLDDARFFFHEQINRIVRGPQQQA